MDYQIKLLDIEDYKSITRLWQKCGLSFRPSGRDSKDSISIEMKRAETGFIGMFDHDNLIGLVLVTSDGRKGWINRLAIDPSYQKQGLGSILIVEGERFLHQLGIKVIAALIEGENKPSFATFKKAGYVFHENIVYYSKRNSVED